MDVTAIRSGIAAAMAGAGYHALAYVPEDAAQCPAAVVGIPHDVKYGLTLGLAQMDLRLTIAVSAADFQDAQLRLNDAMGTGSPLSVQETINAASDASWKLIRLIGTEPARLITVGTAQVLAVDFIVQIDTRK